LRLVLPKLGFSDGTGDLNKLLKKVLPLAGTVDAIPLGAVLLGVFQAPPSPDKNIKKNVAALHDVP